MSDPSVKTSLQTTATSPAAGPPSGSVSPPMVVAPTAPSSAPRTAAPLPAGSTKTETPNPARTAATTTTTAATATPTATAAAAAAASTSTAPLPKPNYQLQTVNDLKALCRSRGLTVSGNKSMLVARLEGFDRDPTAATKSRKRTRDEYDASGASTSASGQQTVPENSVWLRQCVERWGLLPPYDTNLTEAEWQAYYRERKTLEDDLERARREAGVEEDEDEEQDMSIADTKPTGDSTEPPKTDEPPKSVEPPTSSELAAPKQDTPTTTITAFVGTSQTAQSTAASSSMSSVSNAPTNSAGIPKTLFPDEENRIEYIKNLQDKLRQAVVTLVLGCKQITPDSHRTQLATTLGNGIYILSGYTNWEDEEDPRSIDLSTRFYSAIGNGKSVDLCYDYHFRPRISFVEHYSDLSSSFRTVASCVASTGPWNCSAGMRLGSSIMHMHFNDDSHNMKRQVMGASNIKLFTDVLLGGRDVVSTRKAFKIVLAAAGVDMQYEHSIDWLFRVVKRKTKPHRLEETNDEADPGSGHNSNKPYYSDPHSGSDEEFFGGPRRKRRGGDCILS